MAWIHEILKETPLKLGYIINITNIRNITAERNCYCELF